MQQTLASLQAAKPWLTQHLECIHDCTGLQHELVAATDELSASSSNDRAIVDKSGIRRLTGQQCYRSLRMQMRIISNNHLHFNWLACGQGISVVMIHQVSSCSLCVILAKGDCTSSDRSNQSSFVQHVDKFSSLREVAESTAYTRGRLPCCNIPIQPDMSFAVFRTHRD